MDNRLVGTARGAPFSLLVKAAIGTPPRRNANSAPSFASSTPAKNSMLEGAGF